MTLNDEAWTLVESLAGQVDPDTLSARAMELLERRAGSETLVERKAEEGLT